MAVSARQSSTAQVSSIIALAVSVLALATGAYQTRLMQAQARASVWPSLTIDYSIFDEGQNPGFTWQIFNNGVGPARIESVTLSLDDKPMRRWDDVFRVLFPDTTVAATTAGVNGIVLPPSLNRETTINAIHVEAPAQAKGFYAARGRFKMAICYCSVYDECWIAQWRERKARPVERCVTENTVQFEQ